MADLDTEKDADLKYSQNELEKENYLGTLMRQATDIGMPVDDMMEKAGYD